jgi:hypothetical protein
VVVDENIAALDVALADILRVATRERGDSA